MKSKRIVISLSAIFFVILISAFSSGSPSPSSAIAPTTSQVATTSVATTTNEKITTLVQSSSPSQSISAPIPSQSVTTAQPTYGVRAKTSGCVANQTLPDPACSPGAVLTTDTSVICVSGYTQTVRNVPDSVKQKVFAEYGIPWSEHSGYEVDHIISLELGGSNDISNLYPESYSIQYNAHVKDTFENYLHSQICSDKIPVAVAQAEISTDWLKYYLAWKNGTDVPPPVAQVAPTSVPVTTTQTSISSAAYYTSSYGSSKYYYPASCSAWKSLSSKYLVSFPSLQALLEKYPNQTLSPQC